MLIKYKTNFSCILYDIVELFMIRHIFLKELLHQDCIYWNFCNKRLMPYNVLIQNIPSNTTLHITITICLTFTLKVHYLRKCYNVKPYTFYIKCKEIMFKFCNLNRLQNMTFVSIQCV